MMVLIYYLVYVCLVVDKSRVSQLVSHLFFKKQKQKTDSDSDTHNT